jgi:hypothetical protein
MEKRHQSHQKFGADRAVSVIKRGSAMAPQGSRSTVSAVVIMPMFLIIAFVFVVIAFAVVTAPLRLLVDRFPARIVAISVLPTDGARRNGRGGK